MIKTKSIYRYPGGKSLVSDRICEYYTNFNTIISPFLGGGSVELKLADAGKKVISGDIDKQLINCWQSLCNNRDEMYGYALEYYNIFHSDIPKEEKRTLFYEIKQSASEFLDVKGAAQYWIVNRISFSGLGLLGGFSEWSIKAELGPLIMKRLKEWNKPEGFEIPVCMDFETLLDKYPDIPIFMDPPYYLKKGFLYPNHKDFNHIKLSEYLNRSQRPFMMTYNDCSEIRELYDWDGIRIEERSWTYSMAKDKKGKEIFISRGM